MPSPTKVIANTFLMLFSNISVNIEVIKNNTFKPASRAAEFL